MGWHQADDDYDDVGLRTQQAAPNDLNSRSRTRNKEELFSDNFAAWNAPLGGFEEAGRRAPTMAMVLCVYYIRQCADRVTTQRVMPSVVCVCFFYILVMCVG